MRFLLKFVITLIILILINAGWIFSLENYTLSNGVEIRGTIKDHKSGNVVIEVDSVRFRADQVRRLTLFKLPKNDQEEEKVKKKFGLIKLWGGDTIYAWYSKQPDGSLLVYGHRYFPDGTRIKADVITQTQPADVYSLNIFSDIDRLVVNPESSADLSENEWYRLVDKNPVISIPESGIIIVGTLSDQAYQYAVGLTAFGENSFSPVDFPFPFSTGGGFFWSVYFSDTLEKVSYYAMMEIKYQSAASNKPDFGDEQNFQGGIGPGIQWELGQFGKNRLLLNADLMYRHFYRVYDKMGQKFSESGPDFSLRFCGCFSFHDSWMTGIFASANLYIADTVRWAPGAGIVAAILL